MMIFIGNRVILPFIYQQLIIVPIANHQWQHFHRPFASQLMMTLEPLVHGMVVAGSATDTRLEERAIYHHLLI